MRTLNSEVDLGVLYTEFVSFQNIWYIFIHVSSSQVYLKNIASSASFRLSISASIVDLATISSILDLQK